jgi:hypothetical protein
MRQFNKIFGIGLPRSGGQSLQHALVQLTGRAIIHSPGVQLYRYMQDDSIAGAVEVFAPLVWLEREYPDSLYVYNERCTDDIVKSCRRAYADSAQWNHPIWKYHIGQFRDYCQSYKLDHQVETHVMMIGGRVLFHDFVKLPRWDELCAFLDVPVPDEPYPRVDRFKRADN